MGNRNSGSDPKSLLKQQAHRFRVQMPPFAPTGLCDNTPAAVGDFLSFGTTPVPQLAASTFGAGRGCVLIMPFAPVLFSAANADTWDIQIIGKDQFGRYARTILSKTATTRQVEPCLQVFSSIDSAQIIAASTPTNRVRLGFAYGNYTFGAADMDTLNVTQLTGTRRSVPLPLRIRNAAHLLRVERAMEPGMSIITISPSATTFTATQVTVADWTTALVYPAGAIAVAKTGDVAYTSDGHMGVLTANGGTPANGITVTAWHNHNGDVETPANGSGVTIWRPDLTLVGQTKYDVANLGIVPGWRCLPAGVVIPDDVNGVSVAQAVFGIRGNILAIGSEPKSILNFDITIDPVALR